MRGSTKLLLGVAIIAAIGYYAYGRFMPQGGWDQQSAAPPVSVAQVVERDVQIWHEFSGRLVAVEQAEVRPQVSGIIEKVHFKDGVQVRKGDILFTIDQRPFIAALDAARAAHGYAATEYQRAMSLLKDKAMSKREADERYNAYQQAKSVLTRAELDIDHSAIRAPIDGRVSRAEITEGNLVGAGPGAPLLTTIVANAQLYADFDMDEDTFLEYVQAGVTGNQDVSNIPVTLTLTGSENGKTYQGRVASFDNRLNNMTGTIRVRAIFDNQDGQLVPGLFARVRIGGGAPVHALLITDRAVGTDQNKKFVLVVADDGKTERREVKLGNLAEGLRVVREGLKPGEKIIVNGTQRVMMPGQPVTPEMVPMDAPPVELAPAAGGQPADAAASPSEPQENTP